MNSSASTPESSTSSIRTRRHSLARTIPFIVVGAVLLLIAGGFVFAAERERRFEGKIYPGIFIEEVDVSGLTPEQARLRLTQQLNTATVSGASFQLGTSMIRLPGSELSGWIQSDTIESVDNAYLWGREAKKTRNLFKILSLSFHPRSMAWPVQLDESRAKLWLESQTQPLLPLAKNAQLIIDLGANASSTIRIEPEQIGQAADLDPALQEFARQTEARQFHPIQLNIRSVEPSIRSRDLLPLQAQATSWLARAPIALNFEQRTWSVSKEVLANWISATGTEAVTITLDPARVVADINPWLSYTLRPAKEGKLVLDENQALKEFIAPEEGTSINAEATITNIERVLNQTSSTAAIVLYHESPRILGDDAERMGIREVIGVGYSNFSGSPTNRRKNIALGAKHVNGSLIAPDQEFSLLKALGTIDGAHGWFPELVIKGNKTTPEFGGGLCQIGTTVFRAAMNSGLVITERRNHSYRVRYYEPAGTDATIYDPAPDFRFKNDTSNWVLITTQVKGDDLIFTVWGTKDGRRVAPLKPTVSNIVAPPPKKLIPTTDLPPGQTKCTEVAHAGATAKLDYVVTYASGEVKKTVFTSYYKPWGAVCLVGSDQNAPASDVDETGVNNPN